MGRVAWKCGGGRSGMRMAQNYCQKCILMGGIWCKWCEMSETLLFLWTTQKLRDAWTRSWTSFEKWSSTSPSPPTVAAPPIMDVDAAAGAGPPPQEVPQAAPPAPATPVVAKASSPGPPSVPGTPEEAAGSGSKVPTVAMLETPQQVNKNEGLAESAEKRPAPAAEGAARRSAKRKAGADGGGDGSSGA
eukprot:4810977-Pyramimonas_sp.AAC.1